MGEIFGIIGSSLLIGSAIGLVSIALARTVARHARTQRKQEYFLQLVGIVVDDGHKRIAVSREFRAGNRDWR